jgi:cation diffusion facilitator CzcD-associated flavoprotein CzcO
MAQRGSATRDARVVVVGGGPGGISAALALKDVGVRPLVLERGSSVAPSWRGRYDRLRLNTSRWLSHLPDRRFAKGTPLFPSRDDLITHVEHHAREAGFEIQLDTRVERIDTHDGGWRAETDREPIESAQMVIATGYEGEPVIPEWPGRTKFTGRLLHSAEYRNPEPFVGERVLVVGSGCSGMEIAYDLASAGAAKVWLSARTPPNILLRKGPGGLPGDVIATTLLHTPVRFADAFANFGRKMDVGDLSEYGLPIPDEGVFARFHRLGVVPAIVDPEVIDAIKDGQIEVVRGVESLDAGSVRLADGATVEPTVVIAATGYRRGLEPLVGHLGVLDERGLPRAQAAQAAAPGLRFIGYTSRPGALGYMSKQAKQAAKAIVRELADAETRPAFV